MTICNLGIFGTVYERPVPIESPIEIDKNESTRTILVYNIASTETIGNELDVKIRPKSGTVL